MSLLYIDGFDAQDFTTKGWTITNNNGSVTASATTPYATGFSLLSSAVSGGYNTAQAAHSVKPSANLYVGFNYNTTGNPDSTSGQHIDVVRFMTDSGATEQIRVERTSLGFLAVYRGGTLLGQTSASIPVNTWWFVEVGASISATAGSVIVRIQGSQVLSFSGNTQNGGTSTNIDALVFAGGGNYLGTATSPGQYYDDLYVCDGSGTINNTFLGDIRVQTLLPNGPGSSTQFTPTGSANNYMNVSEVPDNANTYNSSGTVGQRDTYAMSNLNAATGTVFGVQQVMRAFKSDAGTANIKSAQKSGATISYGAVNSLSVNDLTYFDMFETNPATGASYTPTDINSIEAGAEIA